MTAQHRYLLIMAAAILGTLAIAILPAATLWNQLPAEDQTRLLELLDTQGGLVVGVMMLIVCGIVLLVRTLHRIYVLEPARLLEDATTLLSSDNGRSLQANGSRELQGLSGVINQFAEQRRQLREDVEARISEARRSVEEEKNRLAALMSELTQSVVVCNLDGRILLYNQRARQQFRALSDTPSAAGGGELIGLGRSIYTLIERNLLAHALENLQHRLGDAQAVSQFVTTTRAGQLLRVQMAPVLAVSGGAEAQMSGYILMLDNITRSFEQETQRDQLLHVLTEGHRSALANIRAAAEMLDYSDLQEELRSRFSQVIRDEVQAISRRLDEATHAFTDAMKSRWPLEEMLGADLIAAARRHIETRLSLPTKDEEIDPTLWLRVDSFSLLQALTYLASRLSDEFEVRELRFRLSAAGRLVHLDMIWSGQAMSTETVMSWELEPMQIGNEHSPLTVRDVIDRHDGEIWLEREKVRHRAFFRLLLPAVQGREQLDQAPFVRAASRPEYYDFDLFKRSPRTDALDEQPLSELAYTVFDTETTGLNPSQGDEIIQIGAARIVNGKLLHNEPFEQLIDPRRPLPPESVQIHGITEDMLRGQPTIEQVLPAFHAFAADTVLVAHNAAFDMRFLQLKESVTGLRFDHPVLDTLLLSALIHPNQESHRLEAIAERFGVTIIGRHTAMGDAIVTAEVFLKMLPLLAERGIHTLGEARRAAEQTYYARIKY